MGEDKAKNSLDRQGEIMTNPTASFHPIKKATAMIPQQLLGELAVTRKFLETSTAVLTEEDSNFAPAEGVFTVAAQMAHIAITIDWFVQGAFFRPQGFNLDFEADDRAARAFTSLAAARAAVARAFDNAAGVLAAQSAESLMIPLPNTGIMDGLPRGCIVGAIVDHTAHHRGALTVYARLLGRTPAMPYG